MSIMGEVNHMARELEASRESLVTAERQAALGALVPVVAHNVRNPLASIHLYARMLDEDLADRAPRVFCGRTTRALRCGSTSRRAAASWT